jgi:protein O-GlcNAc transferase
LSWSGSLSDEPAPSDAARQLTESVRLGQLGDTKTAEKTLRSLLDQYPGNTDANCELGKLLYDSDRIDEAMPFFQTVVDSSPSHVLGLYYLGAIAFARSEWEISKAIFLRLLDIKPDDPRFSNNLGNIAFEQADFELAARYYQSAADASPLWWEAHLNKASALEKLGKTTEALSGYDRAYGLAPGETVVVVAITNAYFEAKKIDHAWEILSRFRESGERTLETELLCGRILLVRGKLDECLSHYQTLTEVAPEAPEVWIDYGFACSEAREFDKGIEAFQKALDLGGEELIVGPNYGNALAGAGDFDGALEMFHRMRELEPDNIDYLLKISNACFLADNEEESLRWLEEALNRDPENIEVLRLFTARKQGSGDANAALGWAQKILDIDPASSVGHFLFTEILQKAEEVEEALEYLEKGLAFDPASKLLLHSAFYLHERLGNNVAAVEAGERYLELCPDALDIEAKLIRIVLTCCEWEYFGDFSRDLIANVKQQIADEQEIAVCPNNLQGLPISYDLLVKAGKNASEQIVRKMAFDRRHTSFDIGRDRYGSKGRIKIGYLLPYVIFHSMPMLLIELIERHDRERFEICCYCVREPADSDFGRYFVEKFDKVRWSESPVELAAMIHEDGIGILVDNSGHTEFNCLDVCALRPAPVIVHYMGYTLSLGAEFFDYIISNPDLVTADQKDMGPEKLIYLRESMFPTRWHSVNKNIPDRNELGLPEDAMVFCNFNQPFKIEPRIFSVWLDILTAVPGSVLWLGDWNELATRNMLRFATNQGFDSDRIVFSKIEQHDRHLARLTRADLGLDTFYHGGGVTSLDYLFVGLPVISATGDTPASRLGSIFLRAHGMSDLIAPNLEEYRDLAVQLALNPERLAEIRQRCIRNRDSELLFNSSRMVANLESSYEAIWQRFLSGHHPQHLYVSSESVEFENNQN